MSGVLLQEHLNYNAFPSETSATCPTQYDHFLHLPQLRALDLFSMTRSEDATGFNLGMVLAKLQHLKVGQCCAAS